MSLVTKNVFLFNFQNYIYYFSHLQKYLKKYTYSQSLQSFDHPITQIHLSKNKSCFFYIFSIKSVSRMGAIIPKVQKRKKSPKKEVPIKFLYSNMVRITKINDINQHFTLLSQIGQGSTGRVFKAISQKTSQVRAIKQISKNNQNCLTSLIENEFAILKTLDHPNIVKMYEIMETNLNFYIVTQLCEGVELFDLLMKVKRFPQKIARGILFQVVSAMNYMHEHHFMHRDLKPENIIYDERTKIVKLIDLSSATFFQSSDFVRRKRIGTSYYIAPQVLQRYYNQKCDIWSLGVIIYVLLSGQAPFGGVEDIDILKNVLYGKLEFKMPIWRSVTEPAKRLIKKMIQRNPQKRLSMEEVIQDDWFKQYLKQNEKENKEGNFVTNALLNLKKFKQVKSANIQNGVLLFIVNFVSRSENESQLLLSFKSLDLNGDGKLSFEELSRGLQKYLKVNLSEAKLMARHIFDKVDLDNSGFIDFSQFLLAASSIDLAINEQNIDLAFDCFDINKDNKLSIEQFREKLGNNFSEKQYKSLLKEFDLNNDNYISREQFRFMMLSLIKSHKP